MADNEKKKNEKNKKQFIRENRKCFKVGYDCGEASLLRGSDPLKVPVKTMQLFGHMKDKGMEYHTLQEWNSLYTRWYDPNTERTNYGRSQRIKIPRGLKRYQHGFAFGFAVGAGFAEEDIWYGGQHAQPGEVLYAHGWSLRGELTPMAKDVPA
jgi:hypothetical protein